MLNICLQNLGAYNEGELRFTWLSLPCTEKQLSAALKKIGIGEKDCFGCEYEEYFVADWECDIPFLVYSEYQNIEYLNSVAKWYESANEDEIKCVSYLMEQDLSLKLEEALESYRSGEIYFVEGIEDEYDAGVWFAQSTGDLDGLPEYLRYYFNFVEYAEGFLMDSATLYGGGMIVDRR